MLEYFGFKKPKAKSPINVYPEIIYNSPAYKINNEYAAREHLEYLKSIADFENTRQNSIESKTTQLVGQTSVVFSLIGLFIPLFIDKFNDFAIGSKVILLILFLIPLIFYIRAIYIATKSYDIHDYPYSTGDSDCIINYSNEKSVLEMRIKDFMYSNKIAHISNDRKADNLIYSNRAFKWGNFTTGLFCVFVLFFGVINSNQSDKKTISVDIERIDSTLNLMNNSIIDLSKSIKEIETVNEIFINDTTIESRYQ